MFPLANVLLLVHKPAQEQKKAPGALSRFRERTTRANPVHPVNPVQKHPRPFFRQDEQDCQDVLRQHGNGNRYESNDLLNTSVTSPGALTQTAKIADHGFVRHFIRDYRSLSVAKMHRGAMLTRCMHCGN